MKILCQSLFVACAMVANAAETNKVLHFPSGVAQLFVDDFLVESQTNLRRTLHQPKKDDGGNKPVIGLENEFGGAAATLGANGTIVYDTRQKKYVMFALS